MSALPHDSLIDRQFAPQAQAYLRSTVHAQGPDLTQLHDLAHSRSFERALDLGCGGGHVAFTLAPVVGSVIAYDLSDTMLAMVKSEAGRRGFPNLSTAQGTAERLPFPDGYFDLVASRYSAHHWRNLRGCLSEVRRVLKAGGRAVVMDAIASEQVLADTWLQTLEVIRDPSHVRDYSLSDWIGMLTDAGLSNAEATVFRLRLEFPSWVARMSTPDVQVSAIRALQQQSPQEVARYFEIEEDGSFTIDTASITVAG